MNAARAETPNDVPAGTRPIRVAVVCDFLEEQWPSMDLAGDMLCRYLPDENDLVSATQLRPALRRRCARFPLIPSRHAWNADRLINRFADYPRWLRTEARDYDLFHVVDHSYSQLIASLPRGRAVVTCHDLDTFRCLLEPEKEDRPRWFRAMARRILEGFRQAAHVIAVSAATRADIIRHHLFAEEQVTVVHNGVHPSCSPLPDPEADAVVARLLPNSEEVTWLLNVGSTQPRKRLDVLLHVFAGVLRRIPGARLVRVGGGFTAEQFRLAAELKVEHALVILPFLERETLAAVYRRAALLLHTAEAEGFGLPLVEAMACGCTVAATDLPVLREVGGTAAVYCGFADLDGWTETLAGLIRERKDQPEHWQFRRHSALAHAARFSWLENARQTARIYQKVLKNDDCY